MSPRGIQNINSIRPSYLFDLCLSSSMILEAIILLDFNPTMSNSWMSVKFKPVPIQRVVSVSAFDLSLESHMPKNGERDGAHIRELG